jgi:hypothetical protein
MWCDGAKQSFTISPLSELKGEAVIVMSVPVKNTYHLVQFIVVAALCLWLVYFVLITILDTIDQFVPWP